MGVAGSDVTWVSVWCRQYSVNFGHAVLVVDEGADAQGDPEPEAESGADLVKHSSALALVILVIQKVFDS